jgi:hypothetical protein
VSPQVTPQTAPPGYIHVGAYFKVVNPAKRQYLDPARFGEAIKYSSVLRGPHCLHALKLLIMDCFPPGSGSFRGAWLGDPVILASDDSGLPNPAEIITATAADPRRNLNQMARDEYTDISYRALAELCRSGCVEELVDDAKRHRRLLVDLGFVYIQYQQKALAVALEQAFGRPWQKAHHEAMATGDLPPLPPIDWPLD